MKRLAACFVLVVGMASAEVSILQDNTKQDARLEGANSQRSRTSFGIRTALTAERLKYELQKDGSYRVKVTLGKRQQFVYVWSDRTLESIAYIAPDEDSIVPSAWITTLNRNCTVKGKWVQKEVTFEERRKKVTRNALVFDFPATEAVKSKELADAIRTVSKIADAAEQEFSLESDTY